MADYGGIWGGRMTGEILIIFLSLSFTKKLAVVLIINAIMTILNQ